MKIKQIQKPLHDWIIVSKLLGTLIFRFNKRGFLFSITYSSKESKFIVGSLCLRFVKKIYFLFRKYTLSIELSYPHFFLSTYLISSGMFRSYLNFAYLIIYCLYLASSLFSSTIYCTLFKFGSSPKLKFFITSANY